MARPYAVFDIDGTLIRWQLYHALADTLAKQGIVNAERYKEVLQARFGWKERRSANSFVDYEKALVKLIDDSLPGVDYALFSGACEKVAEKYRDQVYAFTRDLIAELKQQRYLLFAVSASPDELVGRVASYHGFDAYAGSGYEVIDGKLSGHKQVLSGPAKPKRLTELIAAHGGDQEGSIAVGDTGGDIPMLEKTAKAIAFNPSRELFERAMQNNWEVVVERKNVVYRLKYDHGRYVLTPSADKQTVIL